MKQKSQNVHDYFIRNQSLIVENEKLKKDNQLLEGTLIENETLKQENASLKKMLAFFDEEQEHNFLYAKVIGLVDNNFANGLVLDIGSDENVAVGDVAVDDHGIVGQITSVADKSAIIMPLISANSAIPVQNTRTGVRAVAIGTGAQVSLLYIAANADVREGDVFETSGVDKNFKAGYKVGTVQNINQSKNDKFLEIYLTPFSNIDNISSVFVFSKKAARR